MIFTKTCEGRAVRQGGGRPWALALPPRLVGSQRELKGKEGHRTRTPGPHHPDFGAEAGLAMGLEHPAVVGEQQLQHLAAQPDAQDPDARGEDQGAEQGLLAEVEVVAAAGGTQDGGGISGWWSGQEGGGLPLTGSLQRGAGWPSVGDGGGECNMQVGWP